MPHGLISPMELNEINFIFLQSNKEVTWPILFRKRD